MNHDKAQDTKIPEALPPDTKIGQDYTILRILGQGGFGITYLAQDEILGGQVVIKENMPRDFAVRDRETLFLSPRPQQEENYTWARERFLDEARLLHRLQHPNNVPVTRAFAALNTAYYVMPHVGATELGEAVRNNPDGCSEAYLAEAQFNLGYMYQNGKGVAQNDAEAVSWYRKAAEQGLAAAQLDLGHHYFKGKGVSKDYAEGVGVAKDKEKDLLWLVLSL